MTLIELFNQIEPKSDKFRGHNYESYYSSEFNNKREEKLKILEIGINYGFSINLWSKFFINSEITGVDIVNLYGNLLDGLENVKLFIDDAYSKTFSERFPDNYFDYIIDDGSHDINSQKKCIDLYYKKLKIGGKLIIEDIQGTGYFEELQKYCKDNNLNYKAFDLRGREDDLLIEITRND